MSAEHYLSVRAAARRAGVSASLVYQWCAEGTLAHYRLGASGRRGKILIDPAELAALFTTQRVAGGSPADAPLSHITPRRIP